jgi:hypothetical protein
MKRFNLTTATILAGVVLLTTSMDGTSRYSLVAASVTTKPSSRGKDISTGTSDDNKEKSKKKSFWISLGRGKKKDDDEPVPETEKFEKEKPKSNGPFPFFGRSKNSKTKDHPNDVNDDNKTSENGRNVKPKTDSNDSEKVITLEDDKSEKPREGVEKQESEAETKDGEKNDNITNKEEKDNEKDAGKQQSTGIPHYSVVYRMPTSPPITRIQPGAPGIQPPNQQSQILVAGALVNLVALASRLAFINWLVSKFQSARELKEPEQHFMWECINDKYYKDDMIWKSVQSRPPLSLGFSKLKWNKIVQGMAPSKEERKKLFSPAAPSRAIVLIDLNTMSNPDSIFANFANMVAFLVSANARYKKFFGSEPEIILNIQSTGGEVTSFAIAAAQVKRLRMAGYNVTACVDRFAGSGGYVRLL